MMINTKLCSSRQLFIGLGLLVFNATFNTISVIYRGDKLYLWRKPKGPKKAIDTDLSEVTVKIYHIQLHNSIFEPDLNSQL